MHQVEEYVLRDFGERIRQEFMDEVEQATHALADIARRGRELGIDYAETWSCYKGGDRHCGKCGTYVERREAMKEAGIDDQTEYEE